MVPLRAVATALLALALVKLGLSALVAAGRRRKEGRLLQAAGAGSCLVGFALALAVPFVP